MNTTLIEKINKISMIAFGPEWNGEVENSLSTLRNIFKANGLKATDFEIVLAGSRPRGASSNNTAAMEDLEREFENLTNKYREVRNELCSLKTSKTYGFSNHLAQAEADAVRRKLEEVQATLKQTEAELRKANHAKAEAEAKADAAGRDRDEMQATLEKVTAELREANSVADDLRYAIVGNGPAEVADAVTVTPTGRAEAEGYCPEAAEGRASSDPSDETGAEEQNGWNPRFNKKVVGLYWCTVTGINADLAAGRITTRQASRRKAAAHRSYKAGAKLDSRARNARRAA